MAPAGGGDEMARAGHGEGARGRHEVGAATVGPPLDGHRAGQAGGEGRGEGPGPERVQLAGVVGHVAAGAVGAEDEAHRAPAGGQG